MLTPATLKGVGRYSSLDMYKFGDETVVVHVRDVTLSRKLYYTVGTVDMKTPTTCWGKTTQYGTGQHPSVCLVKINEVLHAVECHCSHVTRKCYYRVGVVSVGEKSIVWSDPKHLGYGKKPKIAGNDNVLAVIMEEVLTLDSLEYYIADITAGHGNPQNNDIAWKPGHGSKDPNFFNGIEPDISINGNGTGQVVVVCRTLYGGEIRAKLGSVTEDKKKINWSAFNNELATCGTDPTISLNSKGNIVQIHQAPWKQLTINCGQITGSVIQWDKEDRTIHYGEYPAIALSDGGVVLEMHCTPIGLSLFYSQGELSPQQ